ncbi:MAG: hypothetical protein WBH57_04870, partial [Anaerolineae bacterium]
AILDYVQIGEPMDGLTPPQRVEANLADKVLLMGHEGVPALMEANQDIHLTLYWQALAQMEADYTVFIHLVDEVGQTVAQHDGEPLLGFYPTSFWDDGEVVRDEYEVHVHPSAPGGEYELVVGMYLLSTGERLPVLDEGGRAIDDLVSLGKVVLVER